MLKFIGSGFLLVLLASCSSSPKKYAEISSFDAESLRFRRPEFVPANPKAPPGGVDYDTIQGQEEYLKNYSCMDYEKIFSEMPVKEIFECLGTVNEFMELKYKLIRVPKPIFQLDESSIAEPSHLKSCWVKLVKEIPVPREIVFHATVEMDELGNLSTPYPGSENPNLVESCFSSTLPLSDDELLGVKVPMAEVVLEVNLPLNTELLPKTEAEIPRLFTSWVLQAYKAQGDRTAQGAIPGVVLPDQFCKKCLGEEWFKDRSPNTKNQWPSPPPAN